MSETLTSIDINPPGEFTLKNVAEWSKPQDAKQHLFEIRDLGVAKQTLPKQPVKFDIGTGPEEHIITTLDWQHYSASSTEDKSEDRPKVNIHTEAAGKTEVYFVISGSVSVYTKIPGDEESERVKVINGPLAPEKVQQATYKLAIEKGHLALRVQTDEGEMELSPNVVIPPGVEHATVADEEQGCLFLAVKLQTPLAVADESFTPENKFTEFSWGVLRRILAKEDGPSLIESHLNELMKNIKTPQDLAVLNNWLENLVYFCADKVVGLELQLDPGLVHEIIANLERRKTDLDAAFREIEERFGPQHYYIEKVGDLAKFDQLDPDVPKITLPLPFQLPGSRDPLSNRTLGVGLADFWADRYKSQALKAICPGDTIHYEVPCAFIKTKMEQGQGDLPIPLASIIKLRLIPWSEEPEFTPYLERHLKKDRGITPLSQVLYSREAGHWANPFRPGSALVLNFKNNPPDHRMNAKRVVFYDPERGPVLYLLSALSMENVQDEDRLARKIETNIDAQKDPFEGLGEAQGEARGEQNIVSLLSNQFFPHPI